MYGGKEAEVIRLRYRHFFCFLPDWLNNEELFIKSYLLTLLVLV